MNPVLAKLRARIRELDRRWVPLLAERTRTLTDQTVRQVRAVGEHRRHLLGRSPAELDRRFASNRLLTTVRELPQLGFVIIAAVFLAGTATVVLKHPTTALSGSSGQVFQEPTPTAGTRLGPDIGETTTGYEVTSLQDLERLADTAPTSVRLALVSFAVYRTPGQIKALLNSFSVRRIYLRSAAGGAEAAELPYDIHGELGPALNKAYADIALSRLAVRQSYLAYVATTKDDKAYHDDYAAYAASTGREVVAYQHGCACVFSAVVEAPSRDLLALRARPGVRAVQIAGHDVQLQQLVLQPLLPETKGLVTRGPVTQSP